MPETALKIDPVATYEDVLNAPPHKVAELIFGNLHTHPRPAMPHARTSSILGGELVNPFDRGRGGPGGWWIVDEPELHLGGHILVPDLAGWRRETMPIYPDAAYCTIAPDWVCEVLSPSTRQTDLTDKRAIYADQKVSYLWLVDPDARTLEAFQLKDGLWVLIASLADDAAVSVPPFAAISFPLSALWIDTGADTKSDKEPDAG